MRIFIPTILSRPGCNCRATRALPVMKINPAVSIFDFHYEDFVLEGYDPHPPIKAQVAV